MLLELLNHWLDDRHRHRMREIRRTGCGFRIESSINKCNGRQGKGPNEGNWQQKRLLKEQASPILRRLR
jgi:hypothetical protein